MNVQTGMVCSYHCHSYFATDGDDYNGKSSSILILADEQKVTCPISTLLDNFVEGDEYFKATLSLATEAGLVVVGTPNMAFVTIRDATSKLRILALCECIDW